MAYTPHTWSTNELVSATKMNYIEQGIESAVQTDQLSSTALTATAGTPTNAAQRTYPVALDASKKLAVNVPWTDSVTGVKGNNESSYRTGNVNITPANVGAVSTDDIANNLTTTVAGKVLDARQGKALKDYIDGLTEKTEDLMDMLVNNHYYAAIASTSTEVVIDENGNEILADWQLKEV